MGIHEMPPQESNRFRRSWNEFQEVIGSIEKDAGAPRNMKDRILELRTALGKMKMSDDTRAFVQILGQAHELAAEFKSGSSERANGSPAPGSFDELPEIKIASGEESDAPEHSLYEKPWTVSLGADRYAASANLTPAESRNRLKALVARFKPDIAQEPREETQSERVGRYAAMGGIAPSIAQREFKRSPRPVPLEQKEPSPLEDATAIEREERAEPQIQDPSFASVEDRKDPKFSETAFEERLVDLGPLPEKFPDTKVDWNEEESEEAAAMRATLHKGPKAETRGAPEELPPADLGPLPEKFPDTKVEWDKPESEEAAAVRSALHKGVVPETAPGPVPAAEVPAQFAHLGAALEAGTALARKEAWAVKLAKNARLGKVRDAMLSAERVRLDEEYGFYAKHSLLGRWFKRRMGGDETDAIAKTDAAYTEKAFAFEQKLEQRLAKHLAKRKEGMTEEEAKAFEAKFAGKYRRMIISKDVIDHGEERLSAMRDRALDEKEKTVFDKGLALYARQNAALEQNLGKQGARAVRILGFSALGATGASFLGAGAAAFGISALGMRLARSVAGTILGGSVGTYAGEKYEEGYGAKAKGALLRARENAASSSEEFAEKRKAYRKGNEQAVERKRRITEALSAAFVGAGVSLETAHMLAGHDALQKAAEHAAGSPKLLGGHTLGSHLGNASGPKPPISSLFESPVVHAARGLGYEHMLKDLRADLLTQGHTAADFPEGSDAHALLSADDAHLNTALHRLATDPSHHFFDTETGRSVAVRAGATLSVDNAGTAHFSADGKVPGAALAPEHAATTPAHHGAPAADERAVTAKLNEEELLRVREGNAANVAWHAAHPDALGAEAAAPAPYDSVPAEQASAPAAATHAPTPLGTHAPAAPHETVSDAAPAAESVGRVAEHALEKGLPFENHNGVAVDPVHTGAYHYEYNGRKILFVSGGGLSENDFQGRLDYIHDTLAKDPNLRGAHVFVDATQLKPDGSTEPAVGELLITDEGGVSLIRGTVENVFTGKKMPLPDPESFTDRYIPPADAARTS